MAQVWLSVVSGAVGGSLSLVGVALGQRWVGARGRREGMRRAYALVLSNGKLIRDLMLKTRGQAQLAHEVWLVFQQFGSAAYELEWLMTDDAARAHLAEYQNALTKVAAVRYGADDDEFKMVWADVAAAANVVVSDAAAASDSRALPASWTNARAVIRRIKFRKKQ